MQESITFLFYQDGAPRPLVGMIATLLCEFDGTTILEQELTVFDAPHGQFILPIGDHFTQEGDWVCSVKFVGTGTVFFSEKFILTIERPAGSA